MVIMQCASGMGDAALREWLPRLWRRIEDAHYSYLEIDDSPEKLQQKKKLEDYIMEYLSRAPHECKFRLAETSKVFDRTVHELPEFNAYRAGLGWAAIARYAANLLNQPWRKEYKVIRLYSGFFKHEVEANMVGAETLLQAMGYQPAGAGRLALVEPLCPDTVAAVSRDALVAHCECQIMVEMWESAVSGAGGVAAAWRDVYRQRTQRAQLPRAHLSHLDSEIYSNVPRTTDTSRVDARYIDYYQPSPDDTPDSYPISPPYMYMYAPHPDVPQCSTVPIMTQYLPYYYPVQTPYMIPTPVYPTIKQANNIPVNGYPPQYRYPQVPTGQLIELDSPAVYENNEDRHRRRPESSRRNSTSKSDVTLPSLPRSDTQPTLSKAKEDGMGTYESWDYVFRNLSSKDQEVERSRYSPSIDRDSRTLDRLEKVHKNRSQPTTLDLEDGLRALSLDHRVEELKKDLKKSRQLVKKMQGEEKRPKRQIEPVGNPKADALVTQKVAPDKVKLLTKKDIKDRKEVIKQQSSLNGTVSSAEVNKVKKPTKMVAAEVEVSKTRPVENGTLHVSHSSKTVPSQPNYDLKAQLIVSLDETDTIRRSPAKATTNGAGTGERPASRDSSHSARERDGKWECGTCTYVNRAGRVCEMCGKSARGAAPDLQPLTSGGRECAACTLVNARAARACDACGTSLEHCPTYI